MLTADNRTARWWPLSSALRLQDPSSPYHPSLTAPLALCHLQRISTTICQSRPLRLFFPLPASPPFFCRMSRCTCVRTRLTIFSKLSTKLTSIHHCYTAHERTRQCYPQQVLPALQWTHDRRSAYRPRFGGRQNSVVTADLLGVSSRLKPLVAEEGA